ncbi:sensor histidine kinase [Niallia sp. Krafla_26]|uniref:sensor histidine kinase n=1 Tax=Niallia sp. Krafla_26 TaxID=3064703 RepID=UPI003D180A38
MGTLIIMIGLMPIMFALHIKSSYKGAESNKALFLYIFIVTSWQLNVGVLYFTNLDQEWVLFLFRLSRIAQTFSLPVAFYIAYYIIRNHPTTITCTSWLDRVLRMIFSQIGLYLSISWSVFVYILNMTEFGVKGLTLVGSQHADHHFYFPEYGSLSWVMTLHMVIFMLFLLLFYFISFKVINRNIGVFLKKFSLYSFILFLIGSFNFLPESELLPSSMGVIVISTFMLMEFTRVNQAIQNNYYQLLERQKKLDYTGNLVGSLIHEVKNTNQIIAGFSKILSKSEALTENEKSALDMTIRASEHLRELANSYKEYMKSSKMEFNIEDLESIIRESIDFSKEIVKVHEVSIEFVNDYKPLKAYVNKIYLQQVFINLIKNSAEAMPKDREKKEIIIETEMKDNSILIHFKDTGKGIPPENWESVFDPFISFKERGMGLGLPFVKKIIIEHLGDIHIVQSTSEGTHFQIEIPQHGAM